MTSVTDVSAVGSPKVTIIVPTLAERKRRDGLLRALDSIKASSTERIRILTVVNGNRFDPETVDLLRAVDGVEVCQTERGSLPYALTLGRSHVHTPYFGFLDDDDEYLPGAIDERLNVFRANPGTALVVTNGYRRIDETEVLALRPLDQVTADPLRSLFRGNWLASCGGLFSSDLIGPQYFLDVNPYAEWTWLAYCIALDNLKVSALEHPTFRINDTIGSASKSEAYRKTFLGLYQRMLARNPPADVAKLIKRRISDSHHDLSDFERQRGNLKEAWRHHLLSLVPFHGLRYLPYTRYLVGWDRLFSSSPEKAPD